MTKSLLKLKRGIKSVADWLKGAMADAFAPVIAPVPVEVEILVGENWGMEK